MDSTNRLSYVDSLRFIAAFLVLIQHSVENFKTLTNSGVWLADFVDLFDFGRMGCVVFFLISGVVIPSSLRDGDKFKAIKKFIVKRFFRLYPVFWLSLPLGWFAGWYIWDKQIELATVLANITMVPECFGKVGIEGLYWTLGVEMLFYCLCICLFYLGVLHKENYLIMLIVILFLLFCYSFINGDDYRVLLHLSLMFWGALFRKYIDNKLLLKTSAIMWNVIIVIAFFIAVLSIIYCSRMLAFKMIGGYSVAICLFLLFTRKLKINNNIMSYFGEISYSIYLFHPVIQYLLYWGLGRLTIMYNHHLILYVLLTVPPTLYFSKITYEHVEKPFVDIGRRMSKKLNMSNPE